MNADELEDELNGEWSEWERLTPAQRWAEQDKLWAYYLSVGGSLDPEPDSQSPFHDTFEKCGGYADGRSGVHLIRRSGV